MTAQDGKDHVIYGLGNKLQVAAASVLPSSTMAEQHRKETGPDSVANRIAVCR